MPTKDTLMIGQILIDEGLVSAQELEIGLREQKKTSEFICSALVRLGFVTEEKVFNLLSRQLNVPYVKLKDVAIDPAVIQKVPPKFASHYKIMPLECKDNILTVAMTDPLDVRTLDDIRLLLGVEVKGVLASEAEISEAARKYYGVGAETIERIIAQKPAFEELKTTVDNVEDLEALAEDASIVKFVNQILTEAIKDRATDIHLEPFRDELRTRFRIDGILYDINIPETIKYFHAAIVSRIKIMGALNIAEHRLPQDGRIKIKIGEEELDLRVSVIPTAFGEAVHIRLLSSRSFLDLANIGLSSEDLLLIERVIKKPHGIIFVTGPTGSGKSTTLYACLARINSPAIKIITVEDPIEYQLRGVNQIQVLPKIGLTFANGLRHILRHDPDVIMIGEVRDFETAEISIRSALTGHLVFSTLHTNDAAGAVTRLLDMGIEPFLVSSSLECLIAQRLVRLLCPVCKEPLKNKADVLNRMKDTVVDAQAAQIFEAKGCEECRFTGYRGRTAIYEILLLNDVIRELIINRAPSQKIKQAAQSQGMRTLRQSGLAKVIRGETTLTEVVRVTQMEDSAG